MTDRFKWEVVVGAALFTGAGLLAGRQFAPQSAADEPPDEAADSAPAGFSSVTLQNLGVTVGAVQPTEFVRTMPLSAVVELPPRAERSVYAPLGGRVLSVDVELGQYVTPGEPLATLLRAPLPRPELTLTADVLQPAKEGLHETVISLRRSTEELRITRTELGRIQEYTEQVAGRELPVIPQQRAIDLEYQATRSAAAVEQAKNELFKHGLSEDQVEAVRAGGALPQLNEQSWKRALDRNGLWPTRAEGLYETLPPAVRELPWVVATIGELAASGLASPELAAWIAGDPEVAGHFLDIGVLLQRGYTLEDLRRLHDLGAFEPIVRITAPATESGTRGWDVHAVLVQPGETLEAGAALVALENPELVYLRVEPIGGEIAAILSTVTSGDRIHAEPMVPGAGPRLEHLRVAFVTSSEGSQGSIAYLTAPNVLWAGLEPGAAGGHRTWGLRRGLRYRLEVPQETFGSVYVLPPGAVTESGPDQVIFLENGDTFTPTPVAIVYRDERAVVIPADSDVAIFPGDRIALSGAFELGMALQSGDSAPDAHAGHSH